MRTFGILLLGMVLGISVALSGVALTGGWYQHRILDRGDDLVAMVNQDGWELVGKVPDSNVWKLRRPRFRLH